MLAQSHLSQKPFRSSGEEEEARVRATHADRALELQIRLMPLKHSTPAVISPLAKSLGTIIAALSVTCGRRRLTKLGRGELSWKPSLRFYRQDDSLERAAQSWRALLLAARLGAPPRSVLPGSKNKILSRAPAAAACRWRAQTHCTDKKTVKQPQNSSS